VILHSLQFRLSTPRILANVRCYQLIQETNHVALRLALRQDATRKFILLFLCRCTGPDGHSLKHYFKRRIPATNVTRSLGPRSEGLNADSDVGFPFFALLFIIVFIVAFHRIAPSSDLKS